MIKNIGTIQAILAINPDAQVTLHGDDYDTIEWGDTAVISKADIDTKLIELEAEWTAQEYARNRATGYPAIGDQLDDLYHAGAFSAEMIAKLKKVKDDNPK